MGVVETGGQRGARLQTLRVRKIRGVRILRDDSPGCGAEHASRYGVVLVELHRAGELRIEANDRRSDAEGRAHQAIRARASAASCDGGASCAGTDRSAESPDAAAGSVLHDAGVDAENAGSGLGSEQVGLGDVQVVAGDIEIEIDL